MSADATPTAPTTAATVAAGPDTAWSVQIGQWDDSYSVAVFAGYADARAYADWHNRQSTTDPTDPANVADVDRIDCYPPGRWHEPVDPRRTDRPDADPVLLRRFGGPRPIIVVLCGSTRFVAEFNRQRKALTEAGEIVLSIEVVTTQTQAQDPQHADPALKDRLDELHKRKIDLADRVLVLDVGGYIGQSTASEIDYARSTGVPITFLSGRGTDLAAVTAPGGAF